MTNNFTPAKAGQQSKRLSKEEYAEKMKAEKEAVYQMADDTAKAIVSDPEKFKALLIFIAVLSVNIVSVPVYLKQAHCCYSEKAADE